MLVSHFTTARTTEMDVLCLIVIDNFTKIMIILHFLNGTIMKIMKIGGIFMGYIIVPINIVEYIRESLNGIHVKNSDI